MIRLPTRLKLADVRYANKDDLVPLQAPITGDPEATMAGWHLIHVDVGRGEVHALGWKWGDVYVTSPVKAIDVERSAIRTRSGRVYRLGVGGDDDDMSSSLARHLVYALRTWGYTR